MLDQAKVLLEDELLSAFLIDGDWLYTASRSEVARRHRNKNTGSFEGKQIVAHGLGAKERACVRTCRRLRQLALISVGPGFTMSRFRRQQLGLRHERRLSLSADGSRLELLALAESSDGPAAFDSEQRVFQLETTQGQYRRTNWFRLPRGAITDSDPIRLRFPMSMTRFARHVWPACRASWRPMYTAGGDRSQEYVSTTEERFPISFRACFSTPRPNAHRVKALKAERRVRASSLPRRSTWCALRTLLSTHGRFRRGRKQHSTFSTGRKMERRPTRPPGAPGGFTEFPGSRRRSGGPKAGRSLPA